VGVAAVVRQSAATRRATQRANPTNAQSGRSFAILLDFDTGLLQQLYPNGEWRNAYADVRAFLTSHGFEWKQGGIYIGNSLQIDAVQCVLAVQKLATKHPWFRPSLRDIRMLRIEEFNDLMVALAVRDSN
jgi:virulence-associated protein VapD